MNRNSGSSHHQIKNMVEASGTCKKSEIHSASMDTDKAGKCLPLQPSLLGMAHSACDLQSVAGRLDTAGTCHQFRQCPPSKVYSSREWEMQGPVLTHQDTNGTLLGCLQTLMSKVHILTGSNLVLDLLDIVHTNLHGQHSRLDRECKMSDCRWMWSLQHT